MLLLGESFTLSFIESYNLLTWALQFVLTHVDGGLTEKREHEDAVVSYPQLICVFKVVSGHKVFILNEQQKSETQREIQALTSYHHSSTTKQQQSFPGLHFTSDQSNQSTGRICFISFTVVYL